MKRILLLALFGVMIGCQPQPIHVEVRPQMQAPAPAPQPAPLPIKQPLVPPAPNFNYRLGYNDGYHGRLLSIRWATFEYRQGHEMGRWDREHGIAPRFVP